MVEKSEKLIAQGNFEAALELLQSGLQQLPGERELVQALKTAREAQAIRKRDEDIEALCRQAQGEMNQREYQQALDRVDRGLAEYGRDRRLTGIREQIIRAKAEWERAQAVSQILQQSKTYLDQQDFDKAIAVLESALKRYPGEAPLAQLMTAAYDALAAKRRDDAIETICRQTEVQIGKREFARALKAVDRALADYGSDARLAAVREKVLLVKANLERADGVRRASKARMSASRRDSRKARLNR